MVQKQNTTRSHSALRARLRRLSNVHYLLILAIISQIIIFDAGKLIQPVNVLQRWVAVGLLTSAVTLVWYAARNGAGQEVTLKKLTGTLIAADIAFASFATYSQRGMAARTAVLFAMPIVVAAALARRSALIATALLSASAYMITCVAYFVLNFNEGYKLELYGEVGFYCAALLVFAFLVWAVTRPNGTK